MKSFGRRFVFRLLIFYLLIDRDDIPLVIDQPQGVLDHHTVYRALVPCVREAKRRRKVIRVTHNPNLVVLCYAEQIISAEIRKDRGNEVTYLSGFIEETETNRKIADVLEGTWSAFDKRGAKYFRNARERVMGGSLVFDLWRAILEFARRTDARSVADVWHENSNSPS